MWSPSDASEVSLERERLDRQDGGVVPSVAESIHHSDHAVELLGEAGQDLGIALPADLSRQSGDVPVDLDPDGVSQGQDNRGDQPADYLFAQLLIGAEENLQQVAPAHDAGDPAAFVDHDKTPHGVLVHQAGSPAEAWVPRE